MTEETAKALAEAMNRLATAIEGLPRNIMGIQVHHSSMGGASGHGWPPPQWPGYQPSNW